MKEAIPTLRTLLLSGNTSNQIVDGFHITFHYRDELQQYRVDVTSYLKHLESNPHSRINVFKPIDILSDEEYTEYTLKGHNTDFVILVGKV